MKIHRYNPYLNEFVELMEQLYVDVGGNVTTAWERLGPTEIEFMRNEIKHCIEDPRYYLENYHTIRTEQDGLTTLSPFWDSQELFYNEVIRLRKEKGAVRVMVLKARQLGLCLSPKTRVLTADLQWIPIEEVVVGQELIAVDEDPLEGTRQARKMRTAKAIAKREVYEPAFRITFTDGREIIATGHHRFLSKLRSGVTYIWREVMQMKPGDHIRHITKPWQEMSYEDGWFGGMLDGEGSLSKNKCGTIACVAQVDGPVYQRVLHYLATRGYTYRQEVDRRKPGTKSKLGKQVLYKAIVGRMDEVFHLIGQTRPTRFLNRHWWEGKDMPGRSVGNHCATIASIELLPAQRMIDLQTSTKTFIAEGFVSHNSTICEGLVFWKTLFTPVCNTLIVATDTVKADHQFEMSRLAHDCLPWWMRPEIRYDQKGRILEFDRKDEWMRKISPGLRSKIIVEAANKTTGVARGLTIRSAHLSELATWEGGGETLTQQIFPTMNATDVMAFMESTAEGRSGFWYRFWKDTADGKTPWHPVFIPFFKVRKYSTPIAKNETFIATQDEEQYRHKILEDSGIEIGDEVLKWRRTQLAQFVSLEGDEFGFMQEYPSNAMEAFQGKGVCAFNKRLLYKMVETTCVAPQWIGEITFDIDARVPHVQVRKVMTGEVLHNPKYDDRLWVWEKPDPEGMYYVAADVAQGSEGGDFSCVEVLKIGAGMEPDVQVAEWRGWINPTPFAYVIAAMGYWYNTAEVSVECNNVGKVTNNEIYRVIQYENVYRWKHIDKIKNSLSNFIGWETTWKSRDALIAKMAEAVSDRSITLRSEWLIDEMLDFSYDEDGGGKAQGQSTKDDRVMAMMICRYCAHDSDYGRQAMARPMSSANVDGGTYYVLDQENRKIAEFADHAQAYQEFLKYKNKGYSIMRGAQARDYANTLYSPIHQGFGLRSRMFYEMGYTAEDINHETIGMEQMAEAGPTAADPNAWLYY